MVPLRDKPFAAILNSRQSKTPLGTDAWIVRTLEAVEYAVRELNATIVSSYGLNTWDLVTWRAGQLAADLELVIPRYILEQASQYDPLVESFGVHPLSTTFHFLDDGPQQIQPKAWWRDRDQTVIEHSDYLIPVSVKPSGGLAGLMEKFGSSATVVRRFTIPYRPVAHHERRLFDRSRLNPQLYGWRDEYVIHWTHACHGPWPGETVAAYCRDLVASHDQYCRSARDTLVRILRERSIRGSCRSMYDGRRMVGLTGATPVDSLFHMKWRNRLVRWSFEPYGIAIRRDVARVLGARSVHYVDETTWRQTSPEMLPFCHRKGVGDIWAEEKEWRLEGDLELQHIPRDAIIVLVRQPDDIPLIQSVWDGEIVSVTQ